MNFVPRIVTVGLASMAVAMWAGPVCAGGLSPGNGGAITLPTVLPPSVRDSVLPPTSSYASSFDLLSQKFGVQDGKLDFFSMRPSDDGGFKPLLRGGVGSGGLQLQLKW